MSRRRSGRRDQLISVLTTIVIVIGLIIGFLLWLESTSELATDPAPEVGVTTAQRHLALGNPSGAVTSLNQPTNYLIIRDQYALSYHRDFGTPNWVSWHLQISDLGDTPRYSGPFITDTTLPAGWYQVTHGDYSGSGYDRGHMTPSADRTASAEANRATFILTNIVPQAPENNQGLWARLEDETRALLNRGYEVYIISGRAGSLGTLANGRLNIPAHLWKVVLALPAAPGDDAARVTAETMLITIWTPNDVSVAGQSWQAYQTSLRCIEERTGLVFFAAINPVVKAALAGPGCEPAAAPPTAPPAANQGFPGCSVDPGPGVAPDTPVQIVTVDKVTEAVTLTNRTGQPIDLTGWILCSIRGGQQHPISGTLPARATELFPNPGGAIWSNSSSDPGALYDADGRLVSYWPD